MSNLNEKEYLIDDSQNTSELTTYDDDKHLNKQKPISAVINFINTSLGSGMLMLPYDMMVCGWALGLCMGIAFCILSTWTYSILVRVSKHAKSYQFDKVCNVLFPKWVGILAQICSIVFSFGCTISYVIVIRDNFFFFQFVNDTPERIALYKNLTLAGIMVLIILPLCFLPSLESLKFNSYLVLIVVAYLISVCVYVFSDKCAKSELPPVIPLRKSSDFLKALPLLTQAFNCQYNFLNIYKELHNKEQNIKKVVVWDTLITTFVYFSIGLFGYFSFGDATKSDILANLAQENGLVSQVANGAMILLMICHYPIMVYSIRKSLEALFIKDLVKWKMYLSNVAIIVVATVIGMFVPEIHYVLSFTSGLAGGTLGFVVTGFLGWKLAKIQSSRGGIWEGVFFVVAGILITGFGFGMAVYELC